MITATATATATATDQDTACRLRDHILASDAGRIAAGAVCVQYQAQPPRVMQHRIPCAPDAAMK